MRAPKPAATTATVVRSKKRPSKTESEKTDVTPVGYPPFSRGEYGSDGQGWFRKPKPPNKRTKSTDIME